MNNNKKLGYIDIQTAQDFMKRAENLSEEILHQIITTCNIQNGRFYPNEFYVALRLIALAQNNFPFTEQEIINNRPIPPLPKFIKYPQFDPGCFNDEININKIYEFLKKFEESMNNKIAKLNKRIEEIDKKNEKANSEIISLLTKIYKKEKKDINQSDHNSKSNESFVKINNFYHTQNKINVPNLKGRRSPEPEFRKINNPEKGKIVQKQQFYSKKNKTNLNLDIINGDLSTLNNYNNNLINFSPENINNNLINGNVSDKNNILPLDGPKRKKI